MQTFMLRVRDTPDDENVPKQWVRVSDPGFSDPGFSDPQFHAKNRPLTIYHSLLRRRRGTRVNKIPKISELTVTKAPVRNHFR